MKQNRKFQGRYGGRVKQIGPDLEKKSYVILIAPVREGSTRPPAGWCEGETSPLKITFIYEDFYDAGPNISVSFSKDKLNGLTSSAIMLLVEQANLDIENWTTNIFGKVEKDDEGNSTLSIRK